MLDDTPFRDAAIALPAAIPLITAFGRRRFHILASQTAGRVAAWEEIVGPGEGTPPHIHHREDELFHALEGRLRIWCGTETFEAGVGATAVLPRGIRHHFLNESDRDARVLVVCTPGGFEGMLAEAGERLLQNPATGPEVFGELAPHYGLEFVA
jgi:mannose-6-phosphate isomerase-like protein (cupin superfamily)